MPRALGLVLLAACAQSNPLPGVATGGSASGSVGSSPSGSSGSSGSTAASSSSGSSGSGSTRTATGG